jgi:hypothetical protein
MSQQKTNQEVSSIRASHELRAKLAKIGARFTLKDGKQRSMEEIIDMLIEEYEKSNKDKRKEKE